MDSQEGVPGAVSDSDLEVAAQVVHNVGGDAFALQQEDIEHVAVVVVRDTQFPG